MAGQFMDGPYKGPDAIPASQGKFMGAPYVAKPLDKVKNIGEGLVDYAGQIPKIFADLGILDRPAAAIARGAGNVARSLGLQVASKEEVNKRLDSTSFSDVTKGSQVGGDPNSAEAKITSNVMGGLETATGLGALAKGISKKLAAKSVAKIVGLQTAKDVSKNKHASSIWKTIAPKATPTEREARAVRGLIQEKGVFKKVGYLPDKQEIELIKTANNVVKPNKSVSSNIGNVIKNIDSEAENLVKITKEKPVTFTVKELASRIGKIEKPLLIKANNLESTYDDVTKKFVEFVNKQPKNAQGLLSARKEFDHWVGRQFPNLYSSETLTPLKSAITDIRRTANNFLSDRIGDNVVKESLKKQSDLYKILENIASKAPTEGDSAIKKFIRNNPSISKAIGYGVGGAGIGSLIGGKN